jgi:hypothetical protein
MRIVLFNGPPSCGKDSAARYLSHAWSEGAYLPGRVDFLRMSHANKRAFAGLVDARIDQWGEVEGWESIKDKPHWLLNDKTYRQWQIEFSEKLMKPLYGQDVFGRLFVNTLDKRYDLFERADVTVLVPDSGFDIEIDTLVKHFRVEDIVLIRVHRQGCDFSNDSRSYLKGAGLRDDRCFDVDNNGSLDAYYVQIVKLLKMVLL